MRTTVLRRFIDVLGTVLLVLLVVWAGAFIAGLLIDGLMAFADWVSE